MKQSNFSLLCAALMSLVAYPAFGEPNPSPINPEHVEGYLAVQPRENLYFKREGLRGSMDDFTLEHCPVTKAKYGTDIKFDQMSENDQIACVYELSVEIEDNTPNGYLVQLSDLRWRIYTTLNQLDYLMEKEIESIRLITMFSGVDAIADERLYSEYYLAANQLIRRNWKEVLRARLIPDLERFVELHSEYTIYLQDTVSEYGDFSDDERFYLQNPLPLNPGYMALQFFDPVLRYSGTDADGHFIDPHFALYADGLDDADFRTLSIPIEGNTSHTQSMQNVEVKFPRRPDIEYKYHWRTHAPGHLIINAEDGWKSEDVVFRSDLNERFCRVKLYEVQNNHGSWFVKTSDETEVIVNLSVVASHGMTGVRHWVTVGADTAEVPPMLASGIQPLCYPDEPEVAASIMPGQCTCIEDNNDWRPTVLDQTTVCGSEICSSFCATIDNAVAIYSPSASCR